MNSSRYFRLVIHRYVVAKNLMHTSAKFCEACALKLAFFSLSTNCSALFFDLARTSLHKTYDVFCLFVYLT